MNTLKFVRIFFKLFFLGSVFFTLLFFLSSCSSENLKSDSELSGKNSQSTPATTIVPDSSSIVKEPNPRNIYIENTINDEAKTIIENEIINDFGKYKQVDLESGSDIAFKIRFIAGTNNSNTGKNSAILLKNPLVFVPVTSFFGFIENISWVDFMDLWKGKINEIEDISGSKIKIKMILSQGTLDILEKNFGKCNIQDLQIMKDQDLPQVLEDEKDAISIIPFDQIKPELKVMNLEGMSIFDKGLDVLKYPLSSYIEASSSNPSDIDKIEKSLGDSSYSNRDITKMITINMTGVTALTRQIAARMDEKGILYPAEKISDVLKDADVTHISNEISFVEDCYAAKPNTVVFCSKPEYIELLKSIGTDVIELTGNHLNDYGSRWLNYSLDIYDREGIKYFGGGRNREESYKPAIFSINDYKVAFIGANSFGPASDWAGENSAGSARINMWDDVQKETDMEKFEGIVKELKQQGYIVIFTFQYMEAYNYSPIEQQIKDFRRIKDAGADIVSGSQAHQPQGVEIRNNGFINYGLGNLFFGQALGLPVKQGLVAHHIFYDGKYINTILVTTLIEDLSQPRVTIGKERADLLKIIFDNSPGRSPE